MGKKMQLISSVFKNKEPNHQNNSWQKWASCTHPRTLSIRADDNIFKTVNSVYLDQVESIETQESWFTSSSECASFTTETEDESLEMVVKDVRSSERLFFEPGDTSSILEEAKLSRINPFNDSVVMSLESNDPFMDFRRSMEEMMKSHELKDWKCLEELLGWYLRVNGKDHHGYILGAFVDLLVSQASSCSDSMSFFNAVSTFSSCSSTACSFGGQNEIHEEV